jgi:nitroreductase
MATSEGHAMDQVLEAIFKRRAIKVFVADPISGELRERILDAARHAPSSFNTQPYKLIWVQSEVKKQTVAKLCLGQEPR